jgi:hypothetical protein
LQNIFNKNTKKVKIIWHIPGPDLLKWHTGPRYDAAQTGDIKVFVDRTVLLGFSFTKLETVSNKNFMNYRAVLY